MIMSGGHIMWTAPESVGTRGTPENAAGARFYVVGELHFMAESIFHYLTNIISCICLFDRYYTVK